MSSLCLFSVFAVINLLFNSPAIELRFMPDPPTLNIYGTHRMNKSDDLELTCRYQHTLLISINPLTHTYRNMHTDSLFLLTCRGRQYLRWATPPTSTRFSTSDCSGSGLFCTTLQISNATVNETGQYQCSYRDLRVEDGKTSAAAYVFVHGITHLNFVLEFS